MTFHGMGADIQGLGDLHIDGTTGKHLKRSEERRVGKECRL